MNFAWNALRIALLLNLAAASAGCRDKNRDGLDRKIDLADQASNSAVVSGYEIQSRDKPTIANGSSPELTRSASPPTGSRFTSLLPTEQKVVSNNALSADSVARLLRGDGFEDAVQQLKIENSRDPLAQDVAEVQGAEMQRRLKRTKVGGLKDMSCGLSVCIGTIDTSGTENSYERFSSDFLHGPSDSQTLLAREVLTDDGRSELRFVMSVDNTLDGVSLPKTTASKN